MNSGGGREKKVYNKTTRNRGRWVVMGKDNGVWCLRRGRNLPEKTRPREKKKPKRTLRYLPEGPFREKDIKRSMEEGWERKVKKVRKDISESSRWGEEEGGRKNLHEWKREKPPYLKERGRRRLGEKEGWQNKSRDPAGNAPKEVPKEDGPLRRKKVCPGKKTNGMGGRQTKGQLNPLTRANGSKLFLGEYNHQGPRVKKKPGGWTETWEN